MSRKGLGMTVIVDAQNRALGVFTDGDLRRVIDESVDFHNTQISAVMTPGGKAVAAEHLAAEAVDLLQRHKITALLVLDEARTLAGVVHLHDLLRAGVY